MKLTDLAILDWVLINNTPHKIQAIDSIDAEILADDDLYYVGEDRCHSEDKIEPIPLTPEILEKNGFERGVVIPSNFYRNIDNERLIFSPHSSCYGLVYVHWNESNDADIMHRLEVQQPIMYIHQMQHALRLFGLDELADNFKI